MSNFFWNWTKTADYQKITQVICLVTYCSFSEVSVFLAPFYLTLKSANVPNLELTWKVWFRYDHTCLSSRAVPFNLVKPWRRNRFNRKKTLSEIVFRPNYDRLRQIDKENIETKNHGWPDFSGDFGQKAALFEKSAVFAILLSKQVIFQQVM